MRGPTGSLWRCVGLSGGSWLLVSSFSVPKYPTHNQYSCCSSTVCLSFPSSDGCDSSRWTRRTRPVAQAATPTCPNDEDDLFTSGDDETIPELHPRLLRILERQTNRAVPMETMVHAALNDKDVLNDNESPYNVSLSNKEAILESSESPFLTQIASRASDDGTDPETKAEIWCAAVVDDERKRPRPPSVPPPVEQNDLVWYSNRLEQNVPSRQIQGAAWMGLLVAWNLEADVNAATALLVLGPLWTSYLSLTQGVVGTTVRLLGTCVYEAVAFVPLVVLDTVQSNSTNVQRLSQQAWETSLCLVQHSWRQAQRTLDATMDHWTHVHVEQLERQRQTRLELQARTLLTARLALESKERLARAAVATVPIGPIPEQRPVRRIQRRPPITYRWKLARREVAERSRSNETTIATTNATARSTLDEAAFSVATKKPDDGEWNVPVESATSKVATAPDHWALARNIQAEAVAQQRLRMTQEQHVPLQKELRERVSLLQPAGRPAVRSEPTPQAAGPMTASTELDDPPGAAEVALTNADEPPEQSSLVEAVVTTVNEPPEQPSLAETVATSASRLEQHKPPVVETTKQTQAPAFDWIQLARRAHGIRQLVETTNRLETYTNVERMSLYLIVAALPLFDQQHGQQHRGPLL